MDFLDRQLTNLGFPSGRIALTIKVCPCPSSIRSLFNTPSSVCSVIDLVRFNSEIVDVNECFRCLVFVLVLAVAIL